MFRSLLNYHLPLEILPALLPMLHPSKLGRIPSEKGISFRERKGPFSESPMLPSTQHSHCHFCGYPQVDSSHIKTLGQCSRHSQCPTQIPFTAKYGAQLVPDLPGLSRLLHWESYIWETPQSWADPDGQSPSSVIYTNFKSWYQKLTNVTISREWPLADSSCPAQKHKEITLHTWGDSNWYRSMKT